MQHGRIVGVARKFLAGAELTAEERSLLDATTGADCDEVLEELKDKPNYAALPAGLSDGMPFALPLNRERYRDRVIYRHVPPGYKPEKPVGLFIFMHGGDTDTPNRAIYDIYLNPEDGRLRPFIDNIDFMFVAPSAPPASSGKRWNYDGTVEYIEAVINEIRAIANIDMRRIVIGGHSMGGFGAYHLSQLLAGRAAGWWLSAGAWQEADFRTLRGSGVYITHGKYDCASHYREFHCEPRHHDWCGVSFARGAHELLNSYGVGHVYDEHDGGHGLQWESTQMAMRRMFVWAAKQRLDYYVPEVTLTTPGGSADPDLENVCFNRWLAIDAVREGKICRDKIILTGPNIAWTIDDLASQGYYLAKIRRRGASISAENLGNNCFRVEAENVKSFSLWLDGSMVDLSRPVNVMLNGVSGQAMCRASLTEALSNIILRRGDDSTPYRARCRIEI